MIGRSQTVSELKEAILEKNPNQLRGIAANQLNLFQVSFPDSEDLRALEKNAREALNDDSKCLTMASRQLSEIFLKNPTKQKVSIVVKVPDIDLHDPDNQVVKDSAIDFTMNVSYLKFWTSLGDELARAGYTLTQPVSEELTLFTPLKPTMHQATSRGGNFVVLKTIFDPNEPRLLRYLSSIKAGSNHTIPLLDVIDLNIGKTIIALPWKSPLDEVLLFRDRVSLCLQFIDGVAFLHQHKVAHRDLKPGNVVVDTKFQSETLPRLSIIDFDLARFVESEETMMEDWCGTPPWIAPELGDRDGPIQRYSPILADRWACGQMVKHFAKYFPASEDEQKATLLAFAQRLLDVSPRARPKLKDVRLLQCHVAGFQHDPLRRPKI
ncbi:kinase-like domain-containing protein [Russula earlei]|uniref:Kinase-like domain-containing protein n=1 Tax=Russula earlei TaxID=71964 RepID=A0ACC0UCA0_9AGAM|nr:kinase-like domain-containing protein [Russula earlei]